MKKVVIFFFLVGLSSIEAYSQDSNCIKKSAPVFYGLDSKQLSSWRKDKNGCLGYREKYIASIKKNSLVIGMPQRLFFILFGKADVVNEADAIYVYYCGCKCDRNMNHLEDSDVIQVIFRFSNGKLISVDFSIT